MREKDPRKPPAGMRPLFLSSVEEATIVALDEIARERFRTRTAEIRLALSEHVKRAKAAAA